MAKNPQLNGLIHSCFESESQMALEMGWSRQRLNKITTGKKVPNLFELNDMAVALHSSIMVLAHIFLAMQSTTVDA